MGQLVKSLDAEIERRSLLKHSFYRMWSEGKLSREHLAGYAQEYFQLVKAVPELVANVNSLVRDGPAKRAISQIQLEETLHIEMWAKFAAAMGVPRDALLAYKGTPKTRRAVSRITRATENSFCGGAAAMYSIESEQPKISKTKLDGLVAFYGMNAEGDETVYFREHQVADVRHAAVWRSLLQKRPARDEKPSLEASRASLSAQNSILDSVMETYVSPSKA